jgi:hypothetical protein
MKRYGLIAMSAKPYHKGHHAAVEKASLECDEVRLFVSLSDRTRPGEVVEYVKVPVASAYDFAGRLDVSGDDVEVVFYADQEDLDKNFPDAKMTKYFPRLAAEGLIQRSPTARLFSGTKMRQFLANGDSKGFESMLPDGIDKEAVWELLSAGAAKPVASKPKAAKKKKSPKRESLRPSLKKLIFG